MPVDENLPRKTLQALLDGPSASGKLKLSVPGGVRIRSIKVIDNVAQIDLSSAFLSANGATARTAVIDTMTSLPAVKAVNLSVEGSSIVESANRVPLLYYASANGLVAVPVSAKDPLTALAAYLSNPAKPELTKLPLDARLLNYKYASADHSLSLDFAYTPSIREMALDKPERMRTVLLGMIASLTEFPEVHAVQLDFEGQTRLGLGQCSDLLRTPQPHPQLLNDERLLDR